MYSFSVDNDKENICPHLGLANDPQSVMDYPSAQNVCHHARPPAPPLEQHQQEYCYGAKYQNCPVFQAESTGKLPLSIGRQIKTEKKSNPLLFSIIGVVGIIAIFISVTLFVYFNLIKNNPVAVFDSSQEQQIPVSGLFKKPTDSVVPSDIVVIETQIPEPELKTSVKEAGIHQNSGETEVAPGIEPVYVFHKVASGEDLLSIADTYGTSVELIRAANLNMRPELWVDTLIIIPIGTQDVSSIIPMTAYEIIDNGISVEEICQKNNVDPDLFRHINMLDDSHEFNIGDQVMIPHPVLTP